MRKNINEKGITLIALVITIIVLLLLAGVAISMLSGDNGILKKTTTAKTETEIKSAEEELKLATMAALSAGNGKLKGEKALEMLNKELRKIKGYVDEGDITSVPCPVKIGNNKYTINEDGTIGNPNEVTMLSGDGQTYYTLAPSTLSFRSSANIADFQEVQINGETVDPSNYTITEGSTIVTLSIDYLKALKEDDYSISIVSKTGSTSAGFSVVKPEVNEHGFYYNQPYFGDTDALLGTDVAILFKVDGMLQMITVDFWSTETILGTYTVEDGIIYANIPDLQEYIGTSNFSLDIVSNTELSAGTDFSFKVEIDTVCSDEDYVYVYNDDLSGYGVMSVIYKDKTHYPNIKSNINNTPVVALGNALFANCCMVEAPEIPDSITHFGEEIFAQCENLEKVILPKNFSILSHACFRDCENLSSITIPKTVKTMKDNVFQYCSNLTEIIFEGTMEEWNSITGIDNSIKYDANNSCAWDMGIPATEVICSDGTVSLN